MPGFAGAQSIALTFDDGFDPREEPQAGVWNQALLDALAKAQIKSIFFAAGKRVDSPAGLQLVRNWGLAGHSVGNHTYSHLDFDEKHTTLQVFISDIERNQMLLKNTPGWVARLRFPYLKEGDSVAKRDGVRVWLDAHHYQSGAVSIDTGSGVRSTRAPIRTRFAPCISLTYGSGPSTMTACRARCSAAAPRT